MSAVQQSEPRIPLSHLHSDFREIFSRPTASIVEAGRVLGYGRNTSYKMAKKGLMPTTPTGRVSTTWLAREVGLLPQASAIAA
ncbi:hypothetical protein [Methylobacterium sp.]|uniref:hypothetical protein n=1 Tax=Methylobacterium sp. TaxID=409 RepID=UPI003AFFBB53